MPEPLNPDASLWDWLTLELRIHREKSGMSVSDLARLLSRDRSNVSNILRGVRKIKDQDAVTLDDHWDTGGRFRRLLGYARLGSDEGWFGEFISHEITAKVIKTYETQAVPGLLQLPEYAGALFAASGASNVDELVSERMSRQRIFEREKPPTLWVLITQTVLDWPVGGPGLMRQQLRHLLEMSTGPDVGIRVVPQTTGAHGGFDGSFSIIFGDDGDIAYTEAPGGGRLVPSAPEVLDYSIRYDRIGQSALPEASSREMIEQAMERL